MSIYDELQIVARDLLTEFHQDGITYVELVPAIGGTPYNPGEPTEVRHPIGDGVARGVEEKYIDGSQVVGSDGQITFAVASFTPKISDFVEAGGKRHKIVAVQPIPLTGTPVANVIIFKR